jgi:NADH-quinone oxidoreductase subunit F
VSDKVDQKRIRGVSEFEQLRAEVRAKQDSIKTWISICGGTSCSASEARPVREALQEAIAKKRLKKKVGLKLTGCHGFCEHGPLVVLSPNGICYERVKREDAAEIIERTVLGDEVIERLLYVDPQTKEKIPLEKDIPFYSRQTRVLLAGNMLVDAATTSRSVGTRRWPRCSPRCRPRK